MAVSIFALHPVSRRDRELHRAAWRSALYARRGRRARRLRAVAFRAARAGTSCPSCAPPSSSRRRSCFPRCSPRMSGCSSPGDRLARSIAPSVAVVVPLAWWCAHNTPPTATHRGERRAAICGRSRSWRCDTSGCFSCRLGLSADNDWPLVSGRRIRGCSPVCSSSWRSSLQAGASATRRDETGRVRYHLVHRRTAADVADAARRGRQRPSDVFSVRRAVAGGHGAAAAAAATPGRAGRATSRAAAVVIGVLVAETAGVYARNEVWRSDESLWRDVTRKSPRNGRGWMNYGVTLMARGDYAGRSLHSSARCPLTPNYHLLYVNLGVVLGGSDGLAEAERHFLRAVSLAPADWRSHVCTRAGSPRVGRGPMRWRMRGSPAS